GRYAHPGPGADRLMIPFVACKRSAFGDVNQHGKKGVHFWAKVKTLTQLSAERVRLAKQRAGRRPEPGAGRLRAHDGVRS
ncbi:hypothetical protein LZC13_09530, partial [Campylobacter coli]|nr:hypothetical protein [Campylobacter coli]